jgi:hypothetical protein
MPSYLRFALFFVVLLITLGGINVFVFRRLSAAFELSARSRKALGAVLLIGLVAMVLGRAMRGSAEHLAEPLGVAGSTIQLATVVAFAVLVLERAARALGRLAGWMWGHAATTPAQPALAPSVEDTAPREPEPLARRDFLSRAAAGAAVGLGVGSAGYASLFGRHDYVIEEVPVRLARLPKALDGFTIVQLSDVHLGTFVGAPEIRSALAMVERAKPDLLVLTGDLLDHDARYAEELGSMVRRLGEHARVVAVVGNHDYYAGLGSVMGSLKKAGAEVLVNRGITIGDASAKVALLGVDDLWGRRFGRDRGPDVDAALRDVPPDLARVLLCHNPAYFPEAAGKVDLQLSGHTHGGQFNPGVRPADLVLPFGYVAGRYQRGDSQLYVNRGFGTAGPPARLGAAPEITKIVLTT